MSLLSRFRRTVLPSNSRGRKVATATDNNIRQYNYRKSTQSFNEKSVKPKNSHLDAYTHDDNNQNTAGGKSSKKNGNNKLFGSSLIVNTSKKNKTDKLFVSSATLSRSNTFTLEDEGNIQNGTYPRFQKKGKDPKFGRHREAYATEGFDEPSGKHIDIIFLPRRKIVIVFFI